MLKRIINQCNLYLVFFVLYEMHGYLYPKTSIINKLLVFYIIGIGVFHFCKVLSLNHKTGTLPFIKALNAFTIVLAIYGIFNIVTGGATPYVTSEVFLKNILLSFLPLYSFYYFSIKGYINSTWIKYVFLILCVLALVQFTQNRLEVLAESAIERVNITNNKGYSFLALMPFLVFWKDRRIIQFMLLLFLTTYIIMAMKRGAIVIGSFCFLFFIVQSFKNASLRQRFLLIALAGVLLFFIMSKLGDLMETNTYFQNRLQSTLEGDTNGRSDIYSSLMNHFLIDANVFNFFFGFGPDATIAYYGHYAHQDWIELLTNCGLIGIILYLRFYVCAYKTACKFDDNSIYVCFMMSIFILLGKSLFSMGYQSIGIYQGLSIGYSLYKIDEYKQRLLLQR